MAKSEVIEQILQRFPTERYKRFWYPTRPLFTLGLGLFIACLGWIGVIPITWALWAAAAFALDDLPLTPIMAMITAINNLSQGRKTLKSTVMIIAIATAAIAGALLGFLVFAHMPVIAAGVAQYIAMTSCSPLLISIGAIVGGYIAHTKKINPFWGICAGVALASFLPIPIPFIVELVFISTATFAFVTSIVTKQALRLYFKYRYGHSNADGYNMARDPEAQAVLISNQAWSFGVHEQDFKRLIMHCRDKITDIKDNAYRLMFGRDRPVHPYLQPVVSAVVELVNIRTKTTNSYKDIYHGLMNPELTPEDVVSVKALISERSEASDTSPENRAKIQKILQFGVFFEPNLADRTLFHRYQIAASGGLDESLTRPFAL